MFAARTDTNDVTTRESTILKKKSLTLTLLTLTKWWAPTSVSKWRMGFNSAFKGLII
jgi:hypothetical protein